MLLTVSFFYLLLTSPYAFYSLFVQRRSKDPHTSAIHHLIKTVFFLLMYLTILSRPCSSYSCISPISSRPCSSYSCTSPSHQDRVLPTHVPQPLHQFHTVLRHWSQVSSRTQGLVRLCVLHPVLDQLAISQNHAQSLHWTWTSEQWTPASASTVLRHRWSNSIGTTMWRRGLQRWLMNRREFEIHDYLE
jgi:hypothetical protein